jgi:hypothetical protein
MSRFSICILLASVFYFTGQSLAAADNRLTPDEQAAGWLLLFDGETPFGWAPAGTANWKVADGKITVSEGEICLLASTTEFGDYHLKVDFRADARTNSGIFLRTSPKPAEPAQDCYELNIAPLDNPFPTGSFVGRKKSEHQAVANEWHTFDVTAEGPRFTVKIDGKSVLEYSDSRPLGRGFIGLQHNSGKVEFKNIKLRPLGLESIFNGRDLSGWKTYPDMKSVFSVTADGHLHVKGGPGQLESDRLYGDFVLQLDCFVGGDGLNSGVFFRCIPGEKLNGYESQIHNGFLNNDRSRPADFGTGGIFRRAPARRVVADDRQWFRKTIIANGPHFSVWVNGYQVVDWTDTRKSDENPRRGLRLAAGTIALQGHDPSTDLSFRNILMKETAHRHIER